MHAHLLTGDLQVQHLAPQGSGEYALTPDTIVLCCHRGRNDRDDEGRFIRADGQPKRRPHDRDHQPGVRQPGIVYVGDYADTYDSRHYIIQPGHFSAPYGAALHFQERAVVPGSRNPEQNGRQASFLVILGIAEPSPAGMRVARTVDDPDEWAPFTDDECREYGMKVEALDRAHMVEAIVPAASATTVGALAAATGGQQPASSRVSAGRGAGKAGGNGRVGKATRIETTADSVLEPLPPEQNTALLEMRQEAAEAANQAGRG